MSYQPLCPAEKPVSQQRMLDILANRANTVRSSTAQSPPDSAPTSVAVPAPGALGQVVPRETLQWAKPIWYEPGVVGCVMSTCGRYHIDKCGASYTAWRRAQRRDHLNLRLGEVESLKLAEGLCRADLGAA